MMKKLLCIVLSVCALFALCSCNGNDKPEETTKAPADFESFIISKDNTNLIEKIRDISVNAADSYCLLKYDGKQYLAKQLKSGNFDALYEFDESCELLDDATKRAGGQYIYFIQNGALKAYYISAGSVLTVVNAPCSNFVTLDVPEKFEIYPYGFIATTTEICVVNLTSASLSSYTKSVNDITTYFEGPDRFFGEKVRTTLSASGRNDIILTVETLKSNGETKEAQEIVFTPILGVFRKEK